MPVAIPLIIATGTVGAAVIASQGAKSAAKTAAEANQAAINAQQAELDKKREESKKAVALKAEALGEFKLPGILETTEGQDLAAKLKARSEGVGVGYSPEILNKYTSATSAQVRAGLKEQTIPSINAAASARGLGRSTIPVSQIGSASQAAERDIEERIAQLQTASEAQAATEKQNALTQYGGLVSEQTKAKQAEAGTRLTGEFDIADTMISSANANLQSSQYISQLIASGGATQASYQLQSAAMMASGIMNAGLSFSQAYSKSNEDIINAINSQQQKNNAMVNIASPSGKITSQDVGMNQNSYRLLPVSYS